MPRSTSHTKTTPQACSYCHARKIRCVFTQEGCRACKESDIECRPRHSGKRGRPRGPRHHAFRTSPDSPELTHALPTPTKDKASTYTSIASGSNHTAASDIEVKLTSPTADRSLPFDWVDFTNTNDWIDGAQRSQTIRSFALPGCGRQSFDPVTTIPDLLPVWSNPTAYPTVHDDDTLHQLSNLDPAPSSLALFDAYLKTHKAFMEINSGQKQVSIEDLNDDSGVMRTLSDVGELGVMTANSLSLAISSLQGSIDQGSLLFAFTAVLKACDLAEHIVKAILPAMQLEQYSSTADHSSPVGFRGPIPFQAKPARPMDDYPAAICSPVTTEHPKLLAERITRLIKLDLQLSRFNQFVSNFIDLTRGQGFSSNVSIPQCQSRLLNLHTRIKAVVDSMTPSWNCKTI